MGDITKNISWHETACRCGCDYLSQTQIKENILTLAYEIQKFVYIISAFYQYQTIVVLFKWGSNGGSWLRCPDHNNAVDGADGSKHIKGIAADSQFILKKTKFQIHPIIIAELALFLSKTGVLNFKGIGCYRTFNHLDMRDNGPVQWIKKDDGSYEYGTDFKNVSF